VSTPAELLDRCDAMTTAMWPGGVPLNLAVRDALAAAVRAMSIYTPGCVAELAEIRDALRRFEDEHFPEEQS